MRKFLNLTVITLSVATLVACGGENKDASDTDKSIKSEKNSSKKKKVFSSAEFIAACEDYYKNGSAEKIVGRFNPVPDVQAYGVSKYCECVDGNINATSAKNLSDVAKVAGDAAEGVNNSGATSAIANVTRKGGVEFYNEALAYDRNPEGAMRPGSYKLMGADDACNEKVQASR